MRRVRTQKEESKKETKEEDKKEEEDKPEMKAQFLKEQGDSLPKKIGIDDSEEVKVEEINFEEPKKAEEPSQPPSLDKKEEAISKKDKNKIGARLFESKEDILKKDYGLEFKDTKKKEKRQKKAKGIEAIKKIVEETVINTFKAREPIGSVPWGLPTIALTRRTIDVQLK